MDKWRIFVYFKSGMNLVTFHIASAYGFDNAEHWARENVLFKPTKKRGVLFKKLGSSRRIYDRQDYEDVYGWHDQGPTEAFNGEYEDDEPILIPPELPSPEALEQGELFPVDKIYESKSIWKYGKETKRRL